MTEDKRPLRVFLCHASSDKPAVRELYEYLVNEGVDAWLDKEKLIPGQNWQIEIPKAVKNSDVVIVCLSTQSVTKEGFVQKEMKLALDSADEKPDGTIFIIPARLENCEVPERIGKYHWVDLFSDNGYEWLKKALQIRAESVGATITPKRSTIKASSEAKARSKNFNKKEPIKSELISQQPKPSYSKDDIQKTSQEEFMEQEKWSPKLSQPTQNYKTITNLSFIELLHFGKEMVLKFVRFLPTPWGRFLCGLLLGYIASQLNLPLKDYSDYFVVVALCWGISGIIVYPRVKTMLFVILINFLGISLLLIPTYVMNSNYGSTKFEYELPLLTLVTYIGAPIGAVISRIYHFRNKKKANGM